MLIQINQVTKGFVTKITRKLVALDTKAEFDPYSYTSATTITTVTSQKLKIRQLKKTVLMGIIQPRLGYNHYIRI